MGVASRICGRIGHGESQTEQVSIGSERRKRWLGFICTDSGWCINGFRQEFFEVGECLLEFHAVTNSSALFRRIPDSLSLGMSSEGGGMSAVLIPPNSYFTVGSAGLSRPISEGNRFGMKIQCKMGRINCACVTRSG